MSTILLVDTWTQMHLRRRHPAEFKARVIAACLQPGVSIAAVALANGLNANFLRSWVKAHRVNSEERKRSPTAFGMTDVLSSRA